MLNIYAVRLWVVINKCLDFGLGSSPPIGVEKTYQLLVGARVGVFLRMVVCTADFRTLPVLNVKLV